MQIGEILARIDHTLLGQKTSWRDIRTLIDEAIRHGAASVCIPPCFVAPARDYCGDAIPICTVIGFPLGYATTAVKVAEVEDAVRNGARELDMVVNLCWVRDREFDRVKEEIQQVKAACGGRILKVIVETSQLNDEEKEILCGVVTDAGADFIKTSTGFAGGGATPQDIMLFAAHVGPGVQIKASGGISNLDEAQRLIHLGASRIGTSRIIKSLEAENGENAGDSY